MSVTLTPEMFALLDSKTKDAVLSAAAGAGSAVGPVKAESSSATGSDAKRRGPKKLEDMTPAERAAHDAKVAERKAAKAAMTPEEKAAEEVKKAAAKAAREAKKAGAPVAPVVPTAVAAVAAVAVVPTAVAAVASSAPTAVAPEDLTKLTNQDLRDIRCVLLGKPTGAKTSGLFKDKKMLIDEITRLRSLPVPDATTVAAPVEKVRKVLSPEHLAKLRSPEHLAKMKAGREKAKAAKDAAKLAVAAPVPVVAAPEPVRAPSPPKVKSD